MDEGTGVSVDVLRFICVTMNIPGLEQRVLTV